MHFEEFSCFTYLFVLYKFNRNHHANLAKDSSYRFRCLAFRVQESTKIEQEVYRNVFSSISDIVKA